MARPTAYTEEMPQKVLDWLETCKDDGKKTDLPTTASLARHIGVSKSTIYLWAENHEEFSDSLSAVVSEQEKRLVNKGLSGEYNSTIAKLMLSSNHGYKERSDKTSGDKPLNDLNELLDTIETRNKK